MCKLCISKLYTRNQREHTWQRIVIVQTVMYLYLQLNYKFHMEVDPDHINATMTMIKKPHFVKYQHN